MTDSIEHVSAPKSPSVTRPDSPAEAAWRSFRKNAASVAGLILLLVVIAGSIVGPFFLQADPFEIAGSPLQAPGRGGMLLGSDYLGRDVFVAIVYGGSATLYVGFAAAGCSLIIGVLVGALAGYYQGWVDEALMRFTEFFQVLPSLLLAMVLVMLFGASLTTITFAIASVLWTGTARLVRAEFLRIRQLDYVRSAQAAGAKGSRIIWGIVLPNASPPIMISAALSFGGAILFESGLSFLGLGDPNVMSWGYFIGANRPYILDAWWATIFPGLAIFVTVLGAGLVGDGLNDAFNPRLQQR